MTNPVIDFLRGLMRVLFGGWGALPPGIDRVFGDGSV